MTQYERELAHLEEMAGLRATIERLDAEKTELRDIKADLEDENRHLSERVKLLEHKRDELIDELKRVGGDKERDFRAGKITAYSEAIRVVLDLIKE